VLTLADLEQIAVANNPSLARAQALVAAARGNWVQAGLYPNPEVGYLGQQLGSGGEAEQHGILFEQEFVRGGKLALDRAVAEQETVRAEQQYAAQLQRVLTDVRIAFYEALLAQRRLELSRELTNIGRQAQSASEQLQRGGELSRADVLQAQLELERAQIEQTNAENRHAAVWRSLTAVIGAPQMPPSVLNGDLEGISPNLTWESSLHRLLTTSPEIAAAVANIDRARLALEREAVEPIPNVTVQGVVMQDNGIGGKTDGNLQLTFPLPLWNKNQGAIRRAEAELAAAQRALGQVELDLQHRLAPVFERYASAAAQVERYRERILPAAQESLGLIRQVFEAGEVPYLNLLNAQRTYSQANLSYLDSLREFQSAAAEIDGLLLRGSLQASP
jgi:cobalt-zinc-cadmium efflux system outer membrane protein